MADTVRESIIASITSKLEEIRTANGYNSDCGQDVRRAAFYFHNSELPAISVLPLVEEAEQQNFGVSTRSMPVQVRAIFLHGASNPSVEGEKILGDIIQCLCGIERILAFHDGSIEIQQGDTITGSIGGATAKVLAVTMTGGSWGGGDAAGSLRLKDQSGSFQAENLLVDGQIAAATMADSTEQPAKWIATGNDKDQIFYRGGGIEDYPQSDDHATMVVANFEVIYQVQAGDPYQRAA